MLGRNRSFGFSDEGGGVSKAEPTGRPGCVVVIGAVGLDGLRGYGEGEWLAGFIGIVLSAVGGAQLRYGVFGFVFRGAQGGWFRWYGRSGRSGHVG